MQSLAVLSSRQDADKLRAFFAERDTTTFSSALAQTIEKIEARASSVERDAADVRDWLAKAGFLRPNKAAL